MRKAKRNHTILPRKIKTNMKGVLIIRQSTTIETPLLSGSLQSSRIRRPVNEQMLSSVCKFLDFKDSGSP